MELTIRIVSLSVSLILYYMVDEGLAVVHTVIQSSHVLVGFCKMVFDIIETDFVWGQFLGLTGDISMRYTLGL